MERVYNELEENLQIVFSNYLQRESDTSEEIRVTLIDKLGTELIYGFSFIRIHDANHLIGSCYGGGYEFIEWIDEDTVTIQPVTDNFKKLGLKVLSVDSELS
jgi:hypothetical protein